MLWAWCAGCANAQVNGVVRLAIGEWAPYTSQTDTKGKLLERVVSEAFKLEGLKVEYTYYPWKRSYLRTEDGTFDGTFPWNSTPEREETFHFHKIPLLNDLSVYFHLKSTPFDWTHLEDLKNYKVGVSMGYKNEKIYRDHGIVADVAPSEELNFKKIASGRIDVYETSKTVGYATIARTLPPEIASQFTHHPKPAEENNYFILFSRKTPYGKDLAVRFDSGMKKLKASGDYDKIFAQ